MTCAEGGYGKKRGLRVHGEADAEILEIFATGSQAILRPRRVDRIEGAILPNIQGFIFTCYVGLDTISQLSPAEFGATDNSQLFYTRSIEMGIIHSFLYEDYYFLESSFHNDEYNTPPSYFACLTRPIMFDWLGN